MEDGNSSDESQEIQMMEPHTDIFEDEGHEDSAVRNDPLPIYETNIPRVACALLASMTTGGVSYAFGLYGNALKRNLHLTQAQLETISSATFCAGLLSWLPGMFVDRFGSRAGITVGGIMGAASLLTYWTVAKQYVAVSSLSLIVAILSALSMSIFLSCALITGAVFKIISCSCGLRTKGKVVGLAKGYVGLGSGAYACIFQSIRTSSTSDLDFLPMCAFLFLVAATIPGFIHLPTKIDERRNVPDALTPIHFRILFASLIILALLIIGSSLLSLFRDKEEISSNYPLAALIVCVWVSPIAAQVYLPQGGGALSYDVVEQLQEDETEQETLLRRSEGAVQSLDEALPKSIVERDGATLEVLTIPDPLTQLSAGNDDANLERHGMAVGGHKNLLEMLQTFPAWLLLWTATILVGGGIVETNNLGQMVESLHFPSTVTPASLSLFSVAQSGGRVVTGALSDWALTVNTNRCFVDRGIPRPFFLVVGSLIGVVAHTILAVSTKEWSFVVGIALSGMAFGSVWPLMVLIVGEIYGTAHVAANYMFYDGCASAAGAFLLSKVVAQQVYDSHIDPHDSDADDLATCFGQECFQMTHVIIASLSLVCVVTSLVLQYSTRDSYNS
jgi:MFS family permease